MTVKLGNPLLAGHGHSPDPNSRRGDTTSKDQVVADTINRLKHLKQVARDRDLLDRVRKLAFFNPMTDRSARIVSGDEVHPKSDQLRDIETRVNRLDERLWPVLSGSQIEIRGPYSDPTGVPDGVGRGSAIELSTAVTVEQIAFQNTVLHQLHTPSPEPLPVKRSRAEPTPARAVIDDCHGGGRDVFSDPINQKRGAAIQARARRADRQRMDQAPSALGVEDDGNLAGLHLPCPYPL